MPLDLAVQVVNFRTKDYLGACLRSVVADLADAPFSHRVFVLDNASGDDLSQLAEEFADVHFDVAERNLGFGAGHNRIASTHDAAALLVLNPDAVFEQPATIARLRAQLQAGAAAVGPQMHDAHGTVDPWDHGELHGFQARLAEAAGHAHSRRRDERTDVAWVSGACALIARRWFDAVGGFDEALFLYKEEEDLFRRMRARGARIVYEPSVRILHHKSVTGARSEHLETAVRQFQAKHAHRAAVPLHRAVVVWGGRARRARELLRGRAA